MTTHELRVPTEEQYAYINFQFEGTSEDAIDEYRRLTELVKGGTGWSEKDFNTFMENMIEKKPNQIDPSKLEEMSASQKYLFNFNRKMLGRLDNRNKQ